MSEVESGDQATVAKATRTKGAKAKGKKKPAAQKQASKNKSDADHNHEADEPRNLHEEITSGVHGLCVKFVYEYSKHLSEFKEMRAAYDEIEARFGQLCAEFMCAATASKRSSMAQGSPEAATTTKPPTRKINIDENILLKKFKTPLESRTMASLFSGSNLKPVMPHRPLLLPSETATTTTDAMAANKKKRKTAESSLLQEKEPESEEPNAESEETKKRKKLKTKKKKATGKGAKGDVLVEEGAETNPLGDLGSVVDDAVEIVAKNVVDKLSIKSESNSSMVKATANNVKTITKTLIKTEVTVEKDRSEVTLSGDASSSSSSTAVGKPSKKIRMSQDTSHLQPLREKEEDDEDDRASRVSNQSSVSTKKKLKKKSLSKKKALKGAKSSSSSQLAEPLASSKSMLSTEVSALATGGQRTPTKTSMAPSLPENILYSNSKTVKQVTKTKPMTRRAAAAAAGTKQTSSSSSSSTMTTTTTTTTTTTIAASIDAQTLAASARTPGKVKQMIDMVEARLKTNGPELVPKTPFSTIKKNPTSHLLSTIKSKAGNPASLVAAAATAAGSNAKKIRSSIDNRKARTSNAKADAKRQSIKRVNAFLSNLAENSEVKVMTPKKEEPEEDAAKTPVAVDSKAQLLNELKPVQTAKKKLFDQDTAAATGIEPKTQVKQAPTVSLFGAPSYESNGVSRTSSSGLLSTIKRPLNVKELISANSTTVNQQYRVVPVVKNTPSHHRPGERKQSFAKFMERNTPSKMTRTELEEKRKAELAVKQAKEAERIQELNSLKNEKIEQTKKKREEKMKKINELKLKQQEEDAKKREELDAKLQTAEENKKKILEEKRREEYERQKQKELRLQAAATAGNNDYHAIQVPNPTVLASAQKKPGYLSHVTGSLAAKPAPTVPPTSFYSNTTVNLGSSTTTTSSTKSEHQPAGSANTYDSLSTIKTQLLLNVNSQQQVQQLMKSSQKPISTYSYLNPSGVKPGGFQPGGGFLKPQDTNQMASSTFVKHEGGVMKPYPMPEPAKPRPLNGENYDVSGLRSDDETDDEEDPSKPIPMWAKEPLLGQAARGQSYKFINYTKLFKAACQNEINLDEIFKYKRKKFNERSSSANWSSPPVWRTNGISGEESFRQFQRL